MTRITQQPWLHRLGGYFLIPHELLHIVGYRLVGKQCRYEWGEKPPTKVRGLP